MQRKPESSKLVYDVENIQRRVAENIKRPIRTMDDLESFLVGWWCRKYGRPYKCAEVLEYTVEELLFEYFDLLFRENPKAMEEFLSKEAKAMDDDDEQWLKGVMGDGYISKDDQEKQMAEIRKNVQLPKASDEEEPDISYKFDDFV